MNIIHSLACAGVLAAAFSSTSAAQEMASKPAPGHPAVCARGVRIFTEKSQIPMPYDTLSIPRSATPVRVTSPEEAEAAELALRARAGSVGATGVLITDVVTESDGGQRMSRSVQGVFVRADSARSQLACKP